MPGNEMSSIPLMILSISLFAYLITPRFALDRTEFVFADEVLCNREMLRSWPFIQPLFDGHAYLCDWVFEKPTASRQLDYSGLASGGGDAPQAYKRSGLDLVLSVLIRCGLLLSALHLLTYPVASFLYRHIAQCLASARDDIAPSFTAAFNEFTFVLCSLIRCAVLLLGSILRVTAVCMLLVCVLCWQALSRSHDRLVYPPRPKTIHGGRSVGTSMPPIWEASIWEGACFDKKAKCHKNELELAAAYEIAKKEVLAERARCKAEVERAETRSRVACKAMKKELEEAKAQMQTITAIKASRETIEDLRSRLQKSTMLRLEQEAAYALRVKGFDEQLHTIGEALARGDDGPLRDGVVSRRKFDALSRSLWITKRRAEDLDKRVDALEKRRTELQKQVNTLELKLEWSKYEVRRI
ncbi:hypothetical protein VTK73DRAFT_3033 [Phialemonium thermophilum]|uniref:Uncharacterized protein n=1 Tax=Phialemonium thermophilum TaxID=223376 RepID=A0ABR3X1W5_9PEZI